MNYNKNKTAIIDGDKTIPCDEMNPDYHLIKYGQEANAEFGIKAIAPTLDLVEAYEAPYVVPQLALNAKSLAYLATTDWYATRFVETGILIPDAIKAKRAQARGDIK